MGLVVDLLVHSMHRVVTATQINLVDLAGSEKIKTHISVSERRLQELTSINQSLSNLGNCIRALGQSGRSHIPYRNSKLTRLLQVGRMQRRACACVLVLML
mgnify:CR=1 FL=1